MEMETDWAKIEAENDARDRAEIRERITAGERVNPFDLRFLLRDNPNDPQLIALRRTQRLGSYERELGNIRRKLESGVERRGIFQFELRPRKRARLLERQSQLGRLLIPPIAGPRSR